MKIATERLPYIEKLATLTLQYLELSLSLPASLRAAEADLSPTVKQLAESNKGDYGTVLYKP